MKRYGWALLLTAGLVLGGCKEDEAASPVAGQAGAGFRIVDQQVGSGAEAVPGRRVQVHYTGRLQSNGAKFDSSLDRGKPFEFNLGAGQVIRCWEQGVAGMKVGGKRQLICPPEVAYGPSGVPPLIPPNATLIFDVELLGVQ